MRESEKQSGRLCKETAFLSSTLIHSNLKGSSELCEDKACRPGICLERMFFLKNLHNCLSALLFVMVVSVMLS